MLCVNVLTLYYFTVNLLVILYILIVGPHLPSFIIVFCLFAFVFHFVAVLMWTFIFIHFQKKKTAAIIVHHFFVVFAPPFFKLWMVLWYFPLLQVAISLLSLH